MRMRMRTTTMMMTMVRWQADFSKTNDKTFYPLSQVRRQSLI